MGAVTLRRIEVGRLEEPHTVRIVLSGEINAAVDDDIVKTMHARKGAFLDEAGPAIEAAFERNFMRKPGKDIEDIEL